LRDGDEQIGADDIGALAIDQGLLAVLPASAALIADEAHRIEREG
jgi:hypothetical protein